MIGAAGLETTTVLLDSPEQEIEIKDGANAAWIHVSHVTFRHMYLLITMNFPSAKLRCSSIKCGSPCDTRTVHKKDEFSAIKTLSFTECFSFTYEFLILL